MHPVRSLELDRLDETRRALAAFAERLRRNLPVERVLLFGSFATGRVHEGSDIDLIVVGRFEVPFFDRALRVARLDEARLPIQLLCYTPEEFRRMVEAENPFILEAIRTGRDL